MATNILVNMEVTQANLAIPEASAIPIAPATQHALPITITSIISVASAIPQDIPLDSTISLVSSAIPVASTIPVPSAILVSSAIPGASTVPLIHSPKLPHFTPTAPTVTPTAPIHVPIPEQTMVSPAWIEDPLRYMAVMTPPSGVPLTTLITPVVELVFFHVN
jgi:hypothetical protein